MLTFFRVTAFSVLALSVFGGEAAFADTPSAINQASPVVEPEAKIAPGDEPICYEVLTNNTTLNLSSLCNRTPKDLQVSSTPTRTRTPYNFTAIKKYHDEVYGEDN